MYDDPSGEIFHLLNEFWQLLPRPYASVAFIMEESSYFDRYAVDMCRTPLQKND
jgi:hypothetical protein